jgi:hypothetical protein
VVLETPAVRLVETVACLPGHRGTLPANSRDDATGYQFTSRVLRLYPGELTSRVAELRNALADDSRALVGVFPGDSAAVTVLLASLGLLEIGWRTWHAYPQTGELVETETTMARGEYAPAEPRNGLSRADSHSWSGVR